MFFSFMSLEAFIMVRSGVKVMTSLVIQFSMSMDLLLVGFPHPLA
jgi:hypothetical protein